MKGGDMVKSDVDGGVPPHFKRERELNLILEQQPQTRGFTDQAT
jgi:hypothetical protein